MESHRIYKQDIKKPWQSFFLSHIGNNQLNRKSSTLKMIGIIKESYIEFPWCIYRANHGFRST